MFARKGSRRYWLKNARHLIHLAKKVWNYRQDILSDFDRDKLVSEREALEVLVKDPASTPELLHSGCDKLHVALRLCGGKLYPVKFIPENIEMLLVAAVLAIGVRSFFIQPFKIPTNSMWPTYYGMTAEVYHDEDPQPSLPERVLRFGTLGAKHYEVEAPVAGEVEIPLFTPGMPGSGAGIIRFSTVMAPKWFGLMRGPVREYTLYVGGTPVKIQVPFEFSLDDVIKKQFYPTKDSINEAIQEAADQRKIVIGGPKKARIKTGIVVKKGEPVLNFDILTGDMLFVDRFTYNFKSPEVGDPFVFRTKNIRGLDGPNGKPTDQYYIKRLAGTAGDKLKIEEPALFINGAPAEGAPAFGYNAERFETYPGYVNRGRLALGKVDTVAAHSFYALGDNSPGSLDSRSWGMVPERDVVGRAVFIFYPFTKRWGIAQ